MLVVTPTLEVMTTLMVLVIMPILLLVNAHWRWRWPPNHRQCVLVKLVTLQKWNQFYPWQWPTYCDRHFFCIVIVASGYWVKIKGFFKIKLFFFFIIKYGNMLEGVWYQEKKYHCISQWAIIKNKFLLDAISPPSQLVVVICVGKG